jgi:hypothetical protein
MKAATTNDVLPSDRSESKAKGSSSHTVAHTVWGGKNDSKKQVCVRVKENDKVSEGGRDCVCVCVCLFVS